MDEQEIKGYEETPKRGGILRNKVVWITLIAVIIGGVIIKGGDNIKRLMFRKKPEVAEFELVSEGAPVKVYAVKRIDFKDTLPALGTIKGYKEIPLKFQTSGSLESFNFEEGEKIQEGDIIANLEQRDALLKLKYAELEMTSAKKMYDLGAINEDGYEKTRLEYESARSDLEKTNIYAVSDGILGLQDIDVGTYVTPNDKIGMFADISKVFAEFEIIEKDAPKMKLGQKCEIFIDAFPDKTFMGTVDIISPIIEGRTRTQRVRVELRNPDMLFKPGMFARGLIATYEKKNAIIIPASSLRKQEDKHVVFVIKRDEAVDDDTDEAGQLPGKDLGTVEVRPVQVGYMTQDRIEIARGVEEGELVLMEIYQDPQDGEKVEIAEVQEILY